MNIKESSQNKLQVLLTLLNINYKELSDRRETEYKLLGSLVLFYPVLYYGFVTLFGLLKEQFLVVSLTSILISVCVFFVTKSVVEKIKSEHDQYEIIGQTIVKISEKLGVISNDVQAINANNSLIYPPNLEVLVGGPDTRRQRKSSGFLGSRQLSLSLFLSF